MQVGRIIFLALILTSLCTSSVIIANRNYLVASEGQTLTLAEVVRFVRGPTVNLVTNSSARIFWRTDAPTNSTVEYGLSISDLNMSIQNASTTIDHRIDLTGLATGTTYYYRVISNETDSEIYHFKTAPADGEPFKLIILGDNRPSSDTAPVQPAVFSEIIDRVIAENPDIVVMTGDYVESITTDDSKNRYAWELFTNITDRLGHYVPIYGVIGNHDASDKTGATRPEYYLDAFELYDEPRTYSSFDFAGVHFVLLDTEQHGLEGRVTGEQWDWLVNDLISTNADVKFVFAHRPLYPCGHIGSALDMNKTERQMLQQLFEEQNVTMFAAGHDHLFNRLTVNGVVNIITGGAGAPLYKTPWGGAFYHYVRVAVRYSNITFEAVKPDGVVASSYSLPYTGPIEIAIRGIANNSQKPPGVMPEIYFSEIPATYYYSWDGGTNTTVLTGLPSTDGVHILDVYAQNDEGVWSHARFYFTVVVPPTGTTTFIDIVPPSPTQPDIAIIGITIGGIGVVIVAVLWQLHRRRKGY